MEAFLMENLPILLCFLFGMILLIVEAFLPGFGLPGISGALLMLGAVTLTFLWHGGVAALCVLLAALAVTGALLLLTLRSVKRGRLSRSPMILSTEETSEAGYTAANVDALQNLIGKQGVALTPLRPSGLAELDGERLNVVSQGEFIPKDTPVVVDRVSGSQVVVRIQTPVQP